MTLQMYLLLVIIGTVGTALVIAAGTKGTVGGMQVDQRTGIVVSGLVFVIWGLVAVSSFEITIYSGGQTATETFPEVAMLAVIGAAASVYCLFQAAIEEIRATGGI